MRLGTSVVRTSWNRHARRDLRRAGADLLPLRRNKDAVRCWGYNNAGQLGDGSMTDSTTSVAVTGLSGATVMATGDAHSCARVAGGAVRCWGDNDDGQLGNGIPSYFPLPQDVVGSPFIVVEIFADGFENLNP